MSAAPTSPPTDPLLVACLCAQWCRTCDSYRDTLAGERAALARTHPEAATHFLWVDIEDESDRVGELDIEDFPTLLLARGEDILFFGPLLPHAGTLARLLQGALAGDLPPRAAAALAPDVRALPARLHGHPEL